MFTYILKFRYIECSSSYLLADLWGTLYESESNNCNSKTFFKPHCVHALHDCVGRWGGVIRDNGRARCFAAACVCVCVCKCVCVCVCVCVSLSDRERDRRNISSYFSFVETVQLKSMQFADWNWLSVKFFVVFWKQTQRISVLIWKRCSSERLKDVGVFQSSVNLELFFRIVYPTTEVVSFCADTKKTVESVKLCKNIDDNSRYRIKLKIVKHFAPVFSHFRQR